MSLQLCHPLKICGLVGSCARAGLDHVDIKGQMSPGRLEGPGPAEHNSQAQACSSGDTQRTRTFRKGVHEGHQLGKEGREGCFRRRAEQR